MQTLRELAKKHGGDKLSHRYIEVYEKLFAPYRHLSMNVLEIGIFGGKSIQMWRDYFPDGCIYGMDVNPAYGIKEERIQSWIEDSADERVIDRVRKTGVTFQIIIDDGEHHPHHQMKTLFNFWHFLEKGGIYVIEDIYPQYSDSFSFLGCEVFDLRELSGNGWSKLLVLRRRKGGGQS